MDVHIGSLHAQPASALAATRDYNHMTARCMRHDIPTWQRMRDVPVPQGFPAPPCGEGNVWGNAVCKNPTKITDPECSNIAGFCTPKSRTQ